ncbi:uncharacterized protein LOC117125184 isoform X2 [Anneissia japonica]|uniref:uncharacterized protein LOC117125184 isoform X2 n=1 Tax=Anneissia japonica TaxID=1529436 RepID=UPI0014257335|nr:uncharacterized protein LOC117125184 isoform X2 [Anneissia japonica]
MFSVRRNFITKVVTSIVLICIVCFAYNVIMWRALELGATGSRTCLSATRTEQQDMLDECPVLRYNPSIPLPSKGCRRVKPINGSCQLAQELFFSEPTATCKHQLNKNICQINEYDGHFDVECFEKACLEDTMVSLGEINRGNGLLEWQDFPSTHDLETHLRAVFTKKTDHYGFCFIKCAINTKLAQQLLVVPPFIRPNKNSDSQSQSKFNINIMLIDSVSHSHFLRSMPTTLKALRSIQKTSTSVFNFELFQSLKSRTYENLQAMFSGVLYNEKRLYLEPELPPVPIYPERLLAGFKKQGYETMYTGDLCWTWRQGLVKDLLAVMSKGNITTRWRRLKMKLEKAKIDRIDMTLASCEILHYNHIYLPFLAEPPAVCYNGQYQHHYILDYLSKRQKSLEANHRSFFHSTLLNMAHEDSGRRIQTLDESLAEYLKMVSKLNNTFTIVLSDHGNSYGEYLERSEEGRVEMFHSFLFMVVPPGVSKNLGETRMSALNVNQQRLVSILDIHYALRYLSEGKVDKLDEKHMKYSIKADGIFSEIASNRSCDSIPRIEPNKCICQDYEHAADNNASYALMAEFALGSINNAIQQQFRKSNPDAMRGFGSCQRLVAHRFGNIKQRQNKFGDHEVKMELYIPNPDDFKFMEMFMVLVSRKANGSLKLVTYKRLTKYGPFAGCADKGVAILLCVCSLKKYQNHINLKEMPDFRNYPEVFGSKTSLKPVHKQCLFIFKRKNKAGVVLEAANLCMNKKYTVKLDVTIENMTLSARSPVEADVWPGTMSFLVTMIRTSSNWNYKYTLKYDLVDVMNNNNNTNNKNTE